MLESHREYWMNDEYKNESPDLDVFIVNVHPSFIDINNKPSNYDEIKDRNNDIIYGDRTYSEQYLCLGNRRLYGIYKRFSVSL
jgi:hypothetical protein